MSIRFSRLVPCGAILAALILSGAAMGQTPPPAGASTITPPILDPSTGAAPAAGPAATTPAAPSQPAPAAAAAPPQSAAPSAPAAPQSTAPDSGEADTVTAYKDWSLECFDPALGGLKCQVAHRVVSGNGRQVVLVFSMAEDPKKETTRVQIALPLGIAIPPGVQIAIGNELQRNAPVSRCTPRGCLVEGTASENLLAAMRKGSRGVIVVTTDAGQQVQLPFSLAGFTDAYAAMETANGG